jgi:hypothetical protein
MHALKYNYTYSGTYQYEDEGTYDSYGLEGDDFDDINLQAEGNVTKEEGGAGKPVCICVYKCIYI